jgi:Type VI secretion system (T6SS), amidase effector protein 4
MRPIFSEVFAGYPKKDNYPGSEVLRLIGWDDLINNGNYTNTCAIRVSIALVSAHMSIPGRMSIKKGSLKGSLIEPGQAKLSRMLARPHLLGAPEKFRTGNNSTQAAIGVRSGVLSFWRLHPEWVSDSQGHIDIVSPQNGYLQCASDCYFGAAEIWFWPLK